MIDIDRMLRYINKKYLDNIKTESVCGEEYLKKKAIKEDRQYYGFIPNYYFNGLAEVAKLLPDNKTHTFCDIGCGYNNIIHLADMMGFNYIGVEFDEDVLKNGILQLYNRTGIRMGSNGMFYNEDITEIDFDFLSGVDVVYCYCPISCGMKMQIVLDNICNAMKPGAYMIYIKGNNAACRLRNKIVDTLWIKEEGEKIWVAERETRPPVVYWKNGNKLPII